MSELPSVALTQRFLALCEDHGSQHLVVKLVAVGRATGVPGLPESDDWTTWDAGQMRAAVEYLEHLRVRCCRFGPGWTFVGRTLRNDRRDDFPRGDNGRGGRGVRQRELFRGGGVLRRGTSVPTIATMSDDGSGKGIPARSNTCSRFEGRSRMRGTNA